MRRYVYRNHLSAPNQGVLANILNLLNHPPDAPYADQKTTVCTPLYPKGCRYLGVFPDLNNPQTDIPIFAELPVSMNPAAVVPPCPSPWRAEASLAGPVSELAAKLVGIKKIKYFVICVFIH